MCVGATRKPRLGHRQCHGKLRGQSLGNRLRSKLNVNMLPETHLSAVTCPVCPVCRVSTRGRLQLARLPFGEQRPWIFILSTNSTSSGPNCGLNDVMCCNAKSGKDRYNSQQQPQGSYRTHVLIHVALRFRKMSKVRRSYAALPRAESRSLCQLLLCRLQLTRSTNKEKHLLVRPAHVWKERY